MKPRRFVAFETRVIDTERNLTVAVVPLHELGQEGAYAYARLIAAALTALSDTVEDNDRTRFEALVQTMRLAKNGGRAGV